MILAGYTAIVWVLVLLIQLSVPLASATSVTVFGIAFWLSNRLGITKGQWLGLTLVAIAILAHAAFDGVLTQGLAAWFNQPSALEHRSLLSNLQFGVSQQSRALVLGLTDGDTSALSQNLKADMQRLSLTHLTAVSGTNCSIVIAAVFWLLGRAGLQRKARVIGSLIALAGYLALVGFQPSVLRASLMSVVALVGLVYGGRTAALNSLAIAVLGLLALFPSLAGNYGLALSALATLGLLVAAPWVYQRLKYRIPKWLALSTAVTVSAQLFCLPVLIQLQPVQSWLGVPANILVEPVVAVITVFGVLGAALALVHPVLAVVPLFAASVFAQYIVAVVQFLAAIPGFEYVLPSGVVGTIWLSLLLVSAIIWAKGWPRFRKVSLALVMASVVCLAFQQTFSLVSYLAFPIKNYVYASCDVGQGDATIIHSGGQTALVDVGREPRKINACLRQLRIKTIDLLVLTHFDADHVDGLAGALKGRKVGTALLSSFSDDRPSVKFIEQQLLNQSERVIHAKTGMRATLGEFSYQVLNAGDDLAEDANDGSVAMLWQSATLNIFTLADLGERGQQRIASRLGSFNNAKLRLNPTILKVSHHGSSDQYPELTEFIRPTIATISVGRNNSYGHPTKSALKTLSYAAKQTLRTDLSGAISIAQDPNGMLSWQTSKSQTGG